MNKSHGLIILGLLLDACSKPNIGKESDLQSEPVGLSLAFHCSHLMIRHSQKYEKYELSLPILLNPSSED